MVPNWGLGSWPRRRARVAPGDTALVYDGDRVTYGLLAERVDRLASSLRERGVGPGDRVAVDQPLWTVTGPFGRERSQQSSPYDGVVIGMTTLPLVNPGDAVVHIAIPGQHEHAFVDEPTDEEDLEAGNDDWQQGGDE
jgi:hypothetical protein